jgi:hypothetical protein
MSWEELEALIRDIIRTPITSNQFQRLISRLHEIQTTISSNEFQRLVGRLIQEEIDRIQAMMQEQHTEFLRREEHRVQYEHCLVQQSLPRFLPLNLLQNLETEEEASGDGNIEDSDQDDEFYEIDWNTEDTNQSENIEGIENEDTVVQDVHAQPEEDFIFSDDEIMF